MSMMTRNFCIVLPECPERTEKARQHFMERHVYDVQFFDGIHAEKFGIDTHHKYEVDNPGSGFKIGFKPVGIWLSHWALLSALNLLWDEHFMVLESDAKFPVDWHSRINQAMSDVPRDFDVLYVGSCCTEGRPKTHIKGDVYECKHQMCTHAIIWAKKAIPVVLATQRKVWSPIDISLTLSTLPLLKSYVCLPRIVDQFDTEISP